MRLFREFLNTVKCYFSSSRNKLLTFFCSCFEYTENGKKEFRLNKSIFSAEKGQILARQNDSFIGLMLQQTRKHHRRQTAAQTNGNHIGGVKMRNPTRSFKNHTDILAFFQLWLLFDWNAVPPRKQKTPKRSRPPAFALLFVQIVAYHKGLFLGLHSAEQKVD